MGGVLSLFAKAPEYNPQVDQLQNKLTELQQKLNQMEVQKMIEDNQRMIDEANRQMQGLSRGGPWTENGIVGGKVGEWINHLDKELEVMINKRLDSMAQQMWLYAVAGLKKAGIFLLDVSFVAAIGVFVFYAYAVMAGSPDSKSKAVSRLYLSAIAMLVIKVLTAVLGA